MAKFQGGLDEMVKALQLMRSDERGRLMDELAKRDPNLVDLINSKLFTLKELEFITPKMLVDFISKINISDLALALKLYSPELQNLIISKVTTRLGQDIKDILTGPKTQKSKAQEAEQKVLLVMRTMIDRGELIVSKDDILV